LEFNVPFQRKYGYIRDEILSLKTLQKIKKVILLVSTLTIRRCAAK